METVSGGNASVTSSDNEIEAVVDTALSESETVSGNDVVIGSNEYTEVVQVDLSSLETELVSLLVYEFLFGFAYWRTCKPYI